MNAEIMYRDGCGSHKKDGINRSPQKKCLAKNFKTLLRAIRINRFR